MSLSIAGFRNTRKCSTSLNASVLEQLGQEDNDQFVYLTQAQSPKGGDRLDGLEPNCYYQHDGTQSYHIGPCSYFVAWRNDLCLAVNQGSAERMQAQSEEFFTLPFAPLILFADNGGSIGPITSKRLAEEFNLHFPTIVQKWHKDKTDELNTYRDLQMMFSLAAGTGIVKFW